MLSGQGRPVRTPKFLYFDLGNVLLFFDHRRAARQLAELAGVDEREVFEYVFASDLNSRCDAGLVSGPEFAAEFRERFPCPADDAAIYRAASEIFHVNVPMKAIVGRLRDAGYRLGILSNTCDMHFDWFASGRYEPIPEAFDVIVLSYQLRLSKPDRAIYEHAAHQAGVAPEDVFDTDDIPANVEGARAAGFDAVLFTSAAEYAAELRKRGVRFNY
jgi:putative hydrolase of the HAD superfamily